MRGRFAFLVLYLRYDMGPTAPTVMALKNIQSNKIVNKANISNNQQIHIMLSIFLRAERRPFLFILCFYFLREAFRPDPSNSAYISYCFKVR
jgi:hypothetical protein